MVTSFHPSPTHSIKVEFAPANATAFGGLSLAERLARRLRLWKTLDGVLGVRQGHYDWVTIIKAMVHGLLSGSRGTYAAQEVRQDAALLGMLGLEGAPEEVTVWRALARIGKLQQTGAMAKVQRIWVRRVLERAPRRELLRDGFVPLFGDGTLLEGSARREGTKWIQDKGRGLMWSTLFVGPLIAAGRLAAEGRGEQTCVREMLGEVVDQVLRPLKLQRRTLALLDSLHGDGPTLDLIEQLGVRYIVGANKLAATAATLSNQPESVWQATGPRPRFGWETSGVCVCWIQCEKWERKRLLVGRRWRLEGEFLWNHAGVMSDLREKDVAHLMDEGLSFAQAVWRLYDGKGALETQYKEALSDLGLHHPPCEQLRRNAGFYAVGTLAHTLGVAVDLIGGTGAERGNTRRLDGARRKRPTPRRMRLWRLRRRLFTLPARIARHARTLTVTLLGLCASEREQFEHYWLNICRC